MRRGKTFNVILALLIFILEAGDLAAGENALNLGSWPQYQFTPLNHALVRGSVVDLLMPDGGTLSIRAHSSPEQVWVDITDTGQGIPAGVNIFEPFATTKAEGTGLGLPIVRQIIAAHGGTIDYTSEPGQGTTFTIHLPLGSLSQEVK